MWRRFSPSLVVNITGGEAEACSKCIGGQSGVNFSEKFTKFAWFTLCKLFGNFLINVVNLLTKM